MLDIRVGGGRHPTDGLVTVIEALGGSEVRLNGGNGSVCSESAQSKAGARAYQARRIGLQTHAHELGKDLVDTMQRSDITMRLNAWAQTNKFQSSGTTFEKS